MRSCHLPALLCAIALSVAQAAETNPIPPAELAARIAAHRAPRVVDVRTSAEYAAGHIPDALNVAHDEIGRRRAELGARADEEIVLYCGRGKRQALAQATLRDAGFTGTRVLEGGFDAWIAAGFPQVREPAKP